MCQFSVNNMNAPMHLYGEIYIVGDRDNSLAAERHEITKDAKYLSGRERIQTPGRLIGEMTGGSLASARATATRCRCPPDNWSGVLRR